MTTNSENTYHVPVLLKECLDGLAINPKGVYVDVTFGGGGHSRAIFEQLVGGHLIAFDQDPDARKNAWEHPNFHFVAGNFSYLKNNLRLLGFPKVDGILADLGVSSYQFDKPERGFSIRSDQPLDMRMNPQNPISAFHVVNEMEERELLIVLAKYGEVKSPGRIANRICMERQKRTIKTTGQLVEILHKVSPWKKENQFLAQVFQAIRIAVNNEMEVLEQFLEQTSDVIKPGGRLVVMSYHSLEDRLVKRFIRTGLFVGEPEKDFYGNISVPMQKVGKMIVPTKEEIKVNNRARSAKLRIAQKL